MFIGNYIYVSSNINSQTKHKANGTLKTKEHFLMTFSNSQGFIHTLAIFSPKYSTNIKNNT